MTSKPMTAEERILAVRRALQVAYRRMKYAAAEYETMGAREERVQAIAIRKSILALIMERR